MKSTARFCIACLLVAALQGSAVAWGQTAGVPAPATAPAQPEAPKDALGRDTPRGTVLGFMEAARESKPDVLPLYLNSGLRGNEASELAQKLYVVLNSRLPVRINTLSDRPDGSLVNPLKPNEDVVGTINTARGPLELVVERVNTDGTRVWLFSRATLEAIPDVYSEIDLVTVDRYLPEIVARPRLFGVRVLDWLVLILGVPLGYRLLALLGPLLSPLVAAWRRRLGKAEGPPLRVHGSVRLLLLSASIRWSVLNIDLPLVERQLWSVIRVTLFITGAVWLLLMLNDVGERYARRRVQTSHLGESIALLRLARRVADVLVLCAGGLAVLAYLGIDATAALAGLGIGGIAVALAAQKTLENVIGGFSLVFDKALRVGDFLKLGTTMGTVDRVGLRSTRIRTLDRTMISLPNGMVATANIESFSDRDKFRFYHIVGLSYETTPAQMRLIVARVHELILSETGVETESVRARFFRLSPSSLDIEVVAYIFALDWSRFLEIQEALLLRIMEIIEQTGTSIAFPSQTLHLRDERASPRPSRPMGADMERLTPAHDEVETV